MPPHPAPPVAAPGQRRGVWSSRAGWLNRLGWRPWLLLPLAGIGADSSVPAQPPPEPLTALPITELFWALVILVGLAVAGISWFALARRETRRQSGALQRRSEALEAWYRDLFDNAHDILLSLDLQGRLLSLNRAGRHRLGPAAQPDLNPSFVQWVDPSQRPAFEAALQELRDGQETTHREVTVQPDPDHFAVLRLNLRRQALPGRPIEIHGVAWDVTDQHRAQEALRESEQRLRHSLEERIRIGRDLHDGIIQSIYAVGLSLGTCRQLAQNDPPKALPQLEQAVQDLNGVIREVRAFIEGLEPEALKGREFRTALEAIVAQLDPSHRLNTTLEVDAQAANQLSAQEAADLLQIAREALSNTLRHSGALHAKFTLHPPPGAVELQIRDDGRGFDPAQVRPHGLGLRNMQARARDLGAQFDIQTAPGQGTTLTIHLPVAAPSPP